MIDWANAKFIDVEGIQISERYPIIEAAIIRIAEPNGQIWELRGHQAHGADPTIWITKAEA